MRRHLSLSFPTLVVLVAIAVVGSALIGTGSAFAQQESRDQSEGQPVRITNFPKTQNVAVPEVIPHAKLQRFVEQVVPAGIDRDDYGQLLEAGTVTTAGFTNIALSLQGDVQGVIGEAGAVGAILVPDDPAVLEMFEQGHLSFAVEVVMVLSRREVTMFSVQNFLSLAFPRYRVFLYNATDKTVHVDLFLYLTH